jgi:hypothetical protein
MGLSERGILRNRQECLELPVRWTGGQLERYSACVHTIEPAYDIGFCT